MTQQEMEALADTPTPPAMAGTWTLTAPDGRTWYGTSPLNVAGQELHERVPYAVRIARIMRGAFNDE